MMPLVGMAAVIAAVCAADASGQPTGPIASRSMTVDADALDSVLDRRGSVTFRDAPCPPSSFR